MIKHKIIYPDGSEEIIEHYGICFSGVGGFSFSLEESDYGNQYPTKKFIFISAANVRKIVPMGEVD